MVAANALDLGSCWINQLKWLNEDPDINAFLRELGMKEGGRVYGAVIIGYPASEAWSLPETLIRCGRPFQRLLKITLAINLPK